MSEIHKDIFERLHEANEIWNQPQFLMADVTAITGATAKAIEHFVNPARGLVRLHGSWVNPGTGKRRMFTGGQVLMIAAAYAMNRIGFPQRFSATLAETVERRARNRACGLGAEREYTILTYPMRDADDWAIKIEHEGSGEEPLLPVAVHVLQADRLIDEVHAQLTAIVNGEKVPDFSVADPEPEPNPYSPASDFFLAWEKDEEGHWVYVGLDHSETMDLLEMQGLQLNGDEIEITRPGRSEDHDRDRFRELHDRHEAARLKRVGEAAAKNASGD